MVSEAQDPDLDASLDCSSRRAHRLCSVELRLESQAFAGTSCGHVSCQCACCGDLGEVARINRATQQVLVSVRDLLHAGARQHERFDQASDN